MQSPAPCLNLPDPDATSRFGAVVSEVLNRGDVLLLEGQIGAGKTHFARALIQHRLAAQGLHEDVPSPTFTLVQTYEADCEIWHADLYRLSHPDELFELGLESAFETAICLIEWPDRLGSNAPKNALTLSFELVDEGRSRRVCLSGNIALADRIMERWND